MRGRRTIDTTTFLPGERHFAKDCSMRYDTEGPRLKQVLPLIFAVIAATFIAIPIAKAQMSYGNLVGIVTDSTGASIRGAAVTALNIATNKTEKAKTDQRGDYSFVNLPPDLYRLTVRMAGFKAVTRDQIDVQIGGTVRVNIALPVGTSTQTVTVSASQAGLQTESATLGGVVEGQQVVQAPLNGRNVNNLLDFIPGVVPGGGTQGSTMSNGGSGNFQAGSQTQAISYNNYQIGGGFSGQSVFYIDGMEQNIAENNVDVLVPTQDDVQEFRVSTNDVSPEFGGFAGGVVQISTKSGGNQFHGNLYEYFRNTNLDANDWFSNHEGLGKAPLHQNQYGANLGGPILKNKAFFFFAWEHESLISGSPTSATVPTTLELAGNFSKDPQTIYDPNTGQPFPGNIIPSSRIDPAALKILTLETPDESRVIQNPYTTNFYAEAPIEGYQDQYNARVDYQASEKDSLFARYTFWNPHNGPSDPFGRLTGSGRTGNDTQEGEIGDSHVFNANTIGDLRLSYLENYNFQYPLSNGFDMTSINPNYGAIEQESEHQQGLLPGLSVQGYGIGPTLSQLYWNNNVWAINGSVTKIIGRHTIKAGAEWRQILWENYGNSQGLTLTASPYYTSESASDSKDGNALASFMLGIPSAASITSVGTWHAFLHSYAFYVNDTWQVTHKLTIDTGMRWSQPGSYSEEQNLDTVLQPNTPVSIGNIKSITNPISGSNIPLTGALALVDSPQYGSRREEQLHWNLFAPRLGLAYQFRPKTVARLGYGISFLPAEVTQDGPGNSPINSASTSISNTVGQPLLITVANPLPDGVNLPSGRSQAALNESLGQTITGRIPEQAYGYVQQWNMGVQQALDRASNLTVAYAGAKGTHLVLQQGNTSTGLNLDQLPDQYDTLGSQLLTQVSNPFYGTLPAGTTFGAKTIAEGYLLLPHPQYAAIKQSVPRYGDSTYNALQVSYLRHLKHDGVIQVAYTWSKLLSDTDNTSAFEDGQNHFGVVQDNTNLKAEKSLSLQDLANNLVVDYGASLPFGKEEPFLSNPTRIVNAVVGGWQIYGITTIRSGLPLALVAANNNLITFGANKIRPNDQAGCAKAMSGSRHGSARAQEWFNTSCFSQPGSYSFGNEPRVDSSLRGDPEANFDISINKVFNLAGPVKFRFETEFFDIFNHPQFALPNDDHSSPGFGQVSQQANLPRTIQFAGRLTF